jgi:hypothetical protein
MKSDQRDRVLDVLLAQYNAVRASLDRKAAAEGALVTFNATGIAGVTGYVLSNTLTSDCCWYFRYSPLSWVCSYFGRTTRCVLPTRTSETH